MHQIFGHIVQTEAERRRQEAGVIKWIKKYSGHVYMYVCMFGGFLAIDFIYFLISKLHEQVHFQIHVEP